MNASQSIIVAGKEFPYLAMSVIMGPLVKPNAVSASVVLTLIPYRTEIDGTIEVLTEAEYQKSIILGDILESNDPHILGCLAAVQAAIQQLIIEKNL